MPPTDLCHSSVFHLVRPNPGTQRATSDPFVRTAAPVLFVVFTADDAIAATDSDAIADIAALYSIDSDLTAVDLLVLLLSAPPC